MESIEMLVSRIAAMDRTKLDMARMRLCELVEQAIESRSRPALCPVESCVEERERGIPIAERPSA